MAGFCKSILLQDNGEAIVLGKTVSDIEAFSPWGSLPLSLPSDQGYVLAKSVPALTWEQVRTTLLALHKGELNKLPSVCHNLIGGFLL